jgi:hypothetical protein
MIKVPHGWSTLVAIAMLTAAVQSFSVLAREPAPLPRPRPSELSSTSPPGSAARQQDPTAAEQPPAVHDQACLERLAAAGVVYAIEFQPAPMSSVCVIDTPVRLKAIQVKSGPQRVIRLPDEPVLACRFVEHVGGWVGDLMAPLIAGRLATEIDAVRTGPGYECRTRNRAEGGKLSAHAIGLALDISSIELSNGAVLAIKPNGDERVRTIINTLRTAACGWFTTVLGPGSDAAHAEHLHVDISAHGASDQYRICQ